MSDDWDDDDGEIPSEWRRDRHFLERVADPERANWAQADLALRLTRDRALALAIAADGPVGAERVAIAVDGIPNPPHVIVDRTGRALPTLLAGHMLPYPTPIVGWDRVQIHLGRAAHLAAEKAAALEAMEDRRGVRQLLDRVEHAGPRLAREDFEQLATLAPLLGGKYLERLTENFTLLVRNARHVVRLKRLPPSIEHKLQRFWQRFHAVGHYVLLSTLAGKRSFAPWEGHVELPSAWRDREFDPIDRIYFQPIILGRAFVTLRVLAAIASAGELAIPTMKRKLAEAPTATHWARAAYGLVAIARRHSGLRASLARLVGPNRLPPSMKGNAMCESWARNLQDLMEARWVEPDADDGAEDARMRAVAETVVARRERGYDGDEELPGDRLSFARLAHLDCNFTDGNQSFLGEATAIIAELPDASEMYYPAADLALAPSFTPEAAAALASFFPPPKGPVRAVEKPGRNDACSCGSGMKFKKCCGVSA